MQPTLVRHAPRSAASGVKRGLVLVMAMCLAVGAFAPAAIAKQPTNRTPVVKSKTDNGRQKLDKKLTAQIDAGSNATVIVYATVVGDAKAALALLDDAHAATAPQGKASLILGRINVQRATKLAALSGVVRVGLIELKQTGQPLGNPDPDSGRPRTPTGKLNSRIANLKLNEIPYDQAPPLKGSNFEQLKQLALLDAKTHDFAEAWNLGYDGTGSSVSILDGGTDWGHPDLIGTWKTAASGWPQAYDPYGALVLAVAPSFVDQGLTWYVHTQSRSNLTNGGLRWKVSFATRIGPARNFSAPNATATHTYTFPKGWTKSGTVRLGSHPDDYLLDLYGERPAILVTDPNTAGVYDTVYVDLDDDYDFSDEKPVGKTSPVSYRDLNGDGYTDLSGGLLYYISDGADGTPIPGGPTTLGVSKKGAPGEYLAWTGDFDPGIGGHGTLTASNVVGQGVIAANAPKFADLPGNHSYPGAVIGGAPKAKAAPMGDIYFSFDFSTQLAQFLTNAAGINVISNSYGNSDVDNDGYDAASQEATIWNLAFGSRTTSVHSTGNGAPGYGTTTPPKPYTGIAVGASTQFGGTGWDSARTTDQITDNDVIPWSDRGPGATGANGVDVVADGAYSAGDLTLNTVIDGPRAWETWGGTSRSTPVAVGALALVYQAQRAAHGAAIPAGFALKAKSILKSSALDLGYDSYTQGAGSVQAGDAVKMALGTSGAAISPSEWRPGDYRDDEFDVFTHLLGAGESDTQTFTIGGSGTYDLSDRVLQRVASNDFSFTTKNVGGESAVSFNSPDYLIDLTSQVNAHPDADMMVVKTIYPHSEFDVDRDNAYDQRWTLLAYDWTDQNRDGRLWRDADGDGIVDHTDSKDVDVDDDPLIDYSKSEIQKGEYVRFTYHRVGGNEMQVMVRDPKERMHDGLFLGLQHPERSASIPTTHMTFRVEFYKNVDWGWLSHPATATGSFDATLSVPAGTPAGEYQGAIVASRGAQQTVIPVAVTVPAPVTQAADGSITGSLDFGGASVAEAQKDQTYNNGSFFGAGDWTWRAESGDWRFFYFDVPDATPDGTLFLADTTWNDAAPFTDLDTIIFGPSENSYQLCCDDGDHVDGPYILDTVGKSQNTNVHDGVWSFQTATGTNREVVTGAASEGLHAVVHHQVGWTGDKFDVPFATTVGTASVDPASVSLNASADTGSFDVTFRSSVDLPGLAAEGYGLSQPVTTVETGHQDDPDVPSSATVKRPFTISHASSVTITSDLSNHDLDMFVVYDANHDGTFATSEIIGSSAGPDGNEQVSISSPADGNYQVWMLGFAVSGAPTYHLTVDAVQGNDLTVTGIPAGAVPAGTPVTLHVAFSKAMTAGQDYFGELQLGPTTAPTALSVPIVVHRQ